MIKWVLSTHLVQWSGWVFATQGKNLKKESQRTRSGQFLTFNLNYVTGCNGPLLFLFGWISETNNLSESSPRINEFIDPLIDALLAACEARFLKTAWRKFRKQDISSTSEKAFPWFLAILLESPKITEQKVLLNSPKKWCDLIQRN